MERRYFTKYEQETIKTIVTHAEQSLTYLLVNVYNDIFDYTNVEYKNNHLHFYYSGKELDQLNSDSTLYVQNEVIVKTLLLKYLEENRYIYLIEDKNIQNPTTSIELANKSGKEYNLLVDLPDEIASFLNNVHKRVIVSEELKALVYNNFISPEEKLIEASKEQVEKITIQTIQLESQRQATLQLVTAAETQTKEALRQTKLAREQLQEAKKQTIEAQKQTVEAVKQTQEAGGQTKEALKQTEEAFKQTQEAETQTKEALAQTEEAKKQTAEALAQTTEAKNQTEEALKQTEEAQKQTKYSIWVLVLAIFSLLCGITTMYITNQQRKESNAFNQQSMERQCVVDSVQTQIFQSLDGNANEIKNNTDTIILRQIETNVNVRRINNNLK